jgi:hypothetical protein
MPTRTELLAHHYLKAAGVAAVYINADGVIGTLEIVELDVRLAGCNSVAF